MTTNAKTVVGGAGLLLVLGGIGAAWVGLGHTSGSPPMSVPPVPVRVVKAETGGVERTVTRPGSIHSFAYANLFAKVSGFLQNQKVDIGARVDKGQLLAEIYAPEIQANVEKAQADLQKAQSQVEVTQRIFGRERPTSRKLWPPSRRNARTWRRKGPGETPQATVHTLL